MSETKENTATTHTQADAPRRISVIRIMTDWSYADDTPFVPDDVDRVMALASRIARVRPA